jgi:hypothetical protein
LHKFEFGHDSGFLQWGSGISRGAWAQQDIRGGSWDNPDMWLGSVYGHSTFPHIPSNACLRIHHKLPLSTPAGFHYHPRSSQGPLGVSHILSPNTKRHPPFSCQSFPSFHPSHSALFPPVRWAGDFTHDRSWQRFTSELPGLPHLSPIPVTHWAKPNRPMQDTTSH